MGLASVGQQDDDDDDEEQPSARCDAEDGGEGEQAVGANVNFSRGDVEASHLDLDGDEVTSAGLQKRCWKCSDRTTSKCGR